MCPTEPPGARDERIRTVDLHTIRELLRMKSALEAGARDLGASESYWFELLRGYSEADVFDAAWQHYCSRPRPLWPADVLASVDRLVAARAEAVRPVRAEIVERRSLNGRSDGWVAVFDQEIARGASVEGAMRTADVCRPTSPHGPARDALEFANL